MPSASFLTVLPIVSSSRGLEWDPDHINALITYVSLNFYLACALQEKKGVFVLVKLYLWFFSICGWSAAQLFLPNCNILSWREKQD